MRNKIAQLGLLIAAIFVVKGLVAPGPDVPLSANTASRNHQVVYKITTDRDWDQCYGFDTTYEMPSGTAQRHVSICEGKASAIVDTRTGNSGDFVYLSVQNDQMSAKISCQIYIDGKLVHQTFSDGQFVIASCSGSIP